MISLQKANEVNGNIKNNNYPINEFKTSKLLEGPRIQVKSLANVDNNVVRQIATRYDQDLFSPVTVVVDDEGELLWLIDGNHRIHAKLMLGHHFTPAYVIPFKDLDYEQHNAYYLGCARQVNPLIAKELNENDIKNMISKDVRAGISVQNSEYYTQIAQITDRTIQSVRMTVSGVVNTIGGPKRPYSKQEVQNYTIEKYEGRIVIISIVREYARGIGYILEAMAQTGERNAVLILYHARADSLSKFHHVEGVVKNITEITGLDIQVEILGLKDNEDYAHG